MSAVFGLLLGTPARPVALPSVGGPALAVNGAVVVVPARRGRRVVATDPGGRLGGRGPGVLRGDG